MCTIKLNNLLHKCRNNFAILQDNYAVYVNHTVKGFSHAKSHQLLFLAMHVYTQKVIITVCKITA